jgi:hypothetical protein
MTNRKFLQDLDDPIFLQEGKHIYQMLREKYPESTDEHLDIIINSLCAAIVIVGKSHVRPDNREKFCQLIENIINKNL